MRSTGILMLIVAIVVGAGTAWLVMGFLQNQSQPTSVATESSAIEQTTIVVASSALAFGDTLSREVMREVPWPSASIPEGAFTTISEILAGADRRVTLRNMAPNEPILESRVSGFGGRATLSQVIGEGMRATTIRVNDVNGVAGFVLPGDRVDIMLTRQNKSGGNARDTMITDVILQSLRVLAVDQTSDEEEEAPQVSKAVTLEVTIEQAQKLSLAASVGTLTLSLRNFISTEDDNTKIKTISIKDLKPTTSTARGQSTAQTSTSPIVKVTRGMASKSQTVSRDRGQ